jgi:2-polyprenyl-3-methyl-5-hydroxy-6-metoxy-1,4-benzoquinol methylase
LARDHNLEFQDNEERKYSYEFDHIVREYLLKKFEPEMRRDGTALELGAYRGDMTSQLLQYFNNIDVIEASEVLAEQVQARFSDNVRVTTGLLENVEPSCLYDNIFLVHTLEHLDDPVEVLRRIGSWLAPAGRLFVAVPNANALSRQIAVHMGLISHNSAVTRGEYEHGHRRTYSLDTLIGDVRAAALPLFNFGGVIVKPLANFQFDRSLAEGIVSEEFIAACDSLASVFPDLSSSVYVTCGGVS